MQVFLVDLRALQQQYLRLAKRRQRGIAQGMYVCYIFEYLIMFGTQYYPKIMDSDSLAEVPSLKTEIIDSPATAMVSECTSERESERVISEFLRVLIHCICRLA